MVKHTGPLLGYNNNVPHKGLMYHVQTEDSGSKRPHVITHLFADGGRIVKTRKTSYKSFVGKDNLTEKVRLLMRDQHKAMVIQLRDGDLDPLIDEGRVEIEEKEAPTSIPAPPAKPPPLPHQPAAPAPAAAVADEPASAPLELLERAAKVPEKDFVQEMEMLTGNTPPPPDSVRNMSPPPTGDSPGTYSFVGRSTPPSKRSKPPKTSTPPDRLRSTRPPIESDPPNDDQPPPAVDAVVEKKPRRAKRTAKGGASDDEATNVYKRRKDFVRTNPDLKAASEHASADEGFGRRFVSDRRFDEVVAAFLARHQP